MADTSKSKSAARKPRAKKTETSEPVKAKKTSRKKPEADPVLGEIRACVKALDEKKAGDLRVLDMRGKSPITNYVILATATSEPHMRALAGELERVLKDLNVSPVRREFGGGSGWFVVDAFDFMAHIFLAEQRGAYRIESLWKDAPEVKF